MSALELTRSRLNVQQCQRCPNHDVGRGPIAAEIQGFDAELAVLVPGPTIGESQRGRVAQENGGMLLRAYLSSLLPAEKYAIIPVRGCGGKVEECRGHLEAQLYALDQLQGVLLVGKDAMNAWRPDQHLNLQAGKLGMMLNRWWCIPIPHPESVTLRYTGKDEYAKMIQSATKIISDDEWPDELESRMDKCPVKGCQVWAEWWDPDEVGYCKRHIEGHGKKKWKEARKQWDKWKAMGMQGTLL